MEIALKTLKDLIVNNSQDQEIKPDFHLCKNILSNLAYTGFIKPLKPKPHEYREL